MKNITKVTTKSVSPTSNRGTRRTARRIADSTLSTTYFEDAFHVIAGGRAPRSCRPGLNRFSFWGAAAVISNGRSTLRIGARELSTHRPSTFIFASLQIGGSSATDIWLAPQFVETYRDKPKLSALMRELSWTHNRLELKRFNRGEEREFYLWLCLRERLDKRELRRQLATVRSSGTSSARQNSHQRCESCTLTTQLGAGRNDSAHRGDPHGAR